MYKNYKYLLKPTNTQKKQIDKNINGIRKFIELYQNDLEKKRDLPSKGLEIVNIYINENSEIKDCNKSALINAWYKIHYQEKIKNIERVRSFVITYSEYNKAHNHIKDNTIFINEIGTIRFVKHRDFPNNISIKNYTLSKDTLNKYYVSFLIEIEDKAKHVNLNKNNIVGFDYNLENFLIDNKGNNYNLPLLYEEQEERIAALNKKIENAKENSNKKKKLVLEKRRINKKIVNKRNDYLHKLSKELINKYDYICIESLDTLSMSQHNNYGKRISDLAFGKFVKMLEYKAQETGKKVIKIPMYYPSSKLCGCCGYKNENLKIYERVWVCPKCNTKLERDINAANNILNKGLEMINS